MPGTDRIVTNPLRMPRYVAVALVALATGAWGPIRPTWAADPGPVITRQNAFAIPFSLNPHTAGSPQPEGVELFVSGDRGISWKAYQRQTRSADRFQFRAPRDGEYWFVVRTFGQNQPIPNLGRPAPELRVVVDTNKPTLNLSARVGEAGEILTQWSMHDATLKPATFQLQYRAKDDIQWRPVAIDGREQRAVNQASAGGITWRPPAVDGPVDLRAEVSDEAGNTTVVTQQVVLPPTVAADSASGASTGAVADVPQDPFNQINQNGGGNAAGGAVAPDGRPETANSAEPIPAPAAEGTGPDIPWPQGSTAENTPLADSADEQWQAVGGTGEPSRPQRPDGPRAFSASASTVTPTEALPAPAAPAPTPSPVPDQPSSRLGSEAAPRDAASAEAPQWDTLRLPAGQQARQSRSRRFELDYDVEHEDPARLRRVELWYTNNAGRTWYYYGDDNDKRSPFAVEVNQEGVFGFRLVLHNHDGLASPPPQMGEAADIWVHVDWTPPSARITETRMGRGAEAGQMQIRWEANDAFLADRPITLAYSPQADGPWSIIASDLPNTGQYTWRVGDHLPRTVYLRLEVADKVGNVVQDASREPISTSGLAPQGKIRNMRPLDVSPSP